MANNPTAGDPLRERLVRPRDQRVEASLVAIVVLLVVGAACIRALPTIVQRGAEQRVAGYQVTEAALSSDAALAYRTLAAAVADIAAVHEQSRRWPDVPALAREGVPPFDPGTATASLRQLSWTSHDGGSWVDYQGRSATAGAPAFILRIIDLHAKYHPHPHPGRDYDPAQKTATQIWWFPEGLSGYPGERLTESGGKWIVRDAEH